MGTVIAEKYEIVTPLDDDTGLTVAKHIFVGSKARWDVIGDDAPRHEAFPP